MNRIREGKYDIGRFVNDIFDSDGNFSLVMAILSLAKRKMTEPFCLAWAIVSVLLVICGILIKPSELERYVSLRILILVFLITIGIVWILWFISTQLSILMRKNQELAMQISLLNQDSERMMKKLEELEKRIDQHFAGGDDLKK